MGFPVGQGIRLRARFRDKNSREKVDPTNLRLIVDAEGTVTTYDNEIVQDGPGNYQCVIPTPVPGHYYYRWTGDGMATPDRLLKVDPTHF